MRLNAKGTVGSFGRRKLIYNQIIYKSDFDVFQLRIPVSCLLKSMVSWTT